MGYYICIDDKEKELFEFIKDNLLNLTEVKLYEFSNEKYWVKENKIIFKRYLESKWIDINYVLIWKIFETKFGYNYDQTRDLIKGVVEEVYKLQNKVPYKSYEIATIEQIYNEYNKKNKT